MALTETFGFEERWMRMLIKKLPDNSQLLQTEFVSDAQYILGGLGNRQVFALRDWALAAEVVTKSKGIWSLTPVGQIFLKYDPELEKYGSLWVLHHLLCINKEGIWFYGAYSNLFSPGKFRRSDIKYVLSECRKLSESVLEKKCMTPLLHTMKATKIGTELGVLDYNEEHDLYQRRVPSESILHPAILAYMLLDWAQRNCRNTANVAELMDKGNVGRYLGLERGVFVSMLEIIQDRYSGKLLTFSQTAGLNSITFSEMNSSLEVLSTYYLEDDGAEPSEALKEVTQKRSYLKEVS